MRDGMSQVQREWDDSVRRLRRNGARNLARRFAPTVPGLRWQEDSRVSYL
jgi:hypothetical protein